MSTEELVSQLRQQLGDLAVLSGDAVGRRYHADWSGERPTPPLAVS